MKNLGLTVLLFLTTTFVQAETKCGIPQNVIDKDKANSPSYTVIFSDGVSVNLFQSNLMATTIASLGVVTTAMANSLTVCIDDHTGFISKVSK